VPLIPGRFSFWGVLVPGNQMDGVPSEHMGQMDTHLANPPGPKPQSFLSRHPPIGGTPLRSACTIAGSSPLRGSKQGPSEWEDLRQLRQSSRCLGHRPEGPAALQGKKDWTTPPIATSWSDAHDGATSGRSSGNGDSRYGG